MTRVVLILLLLLLSCSQNPTVSGGSDNPDFIVGVVVSSTNTPEAGIEVSLIPSDYSPIDGSSESIQTVRTNEDGSFRFDAVNGSEFTIQVIDTVQNIGAIESNITPNNDQSLTVELDSLGSVSVLYDDSIWVDTGAISFTGTSIIRKSWEITPFEQSLNQLLFTHIPPGYFESMDITLGARSFTDANVTVIADDTTAVLHKEIDLNELRPLWSFPVIAGVSDSMVTHFGGIESLRTLIENHLSRMELLFQDERFDGAYSFPLDSLYVMGSELTSEVITPPEGFAYRLLYSPFEHSSHGNANMDNRVIIQDHQESLGGTFGNESMAGLAWGFGLVRGAYYIAKEEVYSVNDVITSKGYAPENSIMFLRGETWDPYSAELMNRSGSDLTSDHELNQFNSAENIQITVINSADEPIVGASVELFGVVPHSLSVESSVFARYTTNSSGVIEYISPYLLSDGSSLQYSNMLIKIEYNSEINYRWIPYSEVSYHSITTGNTIFNRTIQI